MRTTQPFPVLHYAVAETDGHVLLNIARNDQASSILELPRAGAPDSGTQDQARVPSATFEAILSSIPQHIFDVVKIDIEGAEVFALRDVSRDMLRRIRQMTVEFHSHAMFGFDIHAEVEGVVARLRSEGFLVLDFSFGARTDVLILNREQLRIPRARAVLWQLCLALPVRLCPAVRFVPVGLRRWVATRFKSLVTGSK